MRNRLEIQLELRKARILAKASEREKDEKISHLSQQLQESRAATDSIQQELDGKKKGEEEAERIRRTAPILTAYLAAAAKWQSSRLRQIRKPHSL